MSEIEVDGNQNRVAGRDYLEITFGAQDREPLAHAQRKRLNEEVDAINQELGIDRRELWRSVHETTGVKTVGEVKKDQYQAALGALQAAREQHQEQARTQALLAELKLAATEKGLSNQLNRYCLREFGEQCFEKLSTTQLQQALKWLDECHPPLSLAGFHNLLSSYPKHFAVIFVLGALSGWLLP